MHIMEYYFKLKIRIHATAWMNLDDIMLSELCHLSKDKLYDSTYKQYLWKSNSQKQKIEWCLLLGRRDSKELLFNNFSYYSQGTAFQFGKMKKVLEMDFLGTILKKTTTRVAQHCECIECHYTLKNGKFFVMDILPQ